MCSVSKKMNKSDEFCVLNTITIFFRMCGSDGVFTGPSPVCEIISCGLHPEVPYGVVEPQLAFFYQESVNISCEEGFRLVSGS